MLVSLRSLSTSSAHCPPLVAPCLPPQQYDVTLSPLPPSSTTSWQRLPCATLRACDESRDGQLFRINCICGVRMLHPGRSCAEQVTTDKHATAPCSNATFIPKGEPAAVQGSQDPPRNGRPFFLLEFKTLETFLTPKLTTHPPLLFHDSLLQLTNIKQCRERRQCRVDGGCFLLC